MGEKCTGPAAALPGAGFACDELYGAVAARLADAGPVKASAAMAAPTTTANGNSAGNDGDWRFDLLRSVGEECQTEPELRALLARKPEFNLYDGFEPSGRMHIAQGLFKANNVNKCTKAGGTFIFWVADWFGLMNDKMGGDLEKIKTVGLYFIEVWKASGMDLSRVKFRWSSDDIVNNAKEYWAQALDIARKSTLARVKKCCQIMGRKEDSLSAAQIMYPIMQSTDIFFLQADVCQLGVDQRKVNMLARDYCDAAGRKHKPIILSHHMVYGLTAGQAKMSKSNPESAIFMEDSPEDVERKIRKAYCPRVPEEKSEETKGDVEEMQLEKDDLMNPCLDYIKHILFSLEGYSFKVAGNTYKTSEEVKTAFIDGQISEDQLKDGIIAEINRRIDPVRRHFQDDATAKALLDQITQWKKENFVPPNTVRRLRVTPPLSKEVFVVFAPTPMVYVQLEDVLSIIRRFKASRAGYERVLWLEDWTALAFGAVGANADAIKAFFDLLLFSLRALDPELMKTVRVCWQGEAILSSPSDALISVINAGRRSTVQDIRRALPHGENLEQASQVFAVLMHIGDVLGFTESSKVILSCDRLHENGHRVAEDHCKALDIDCIEVCPDNANSLRLKAEGEGNEKDERIMITDEDIAVNGKIKKAFCVPQGLEFCPPIAWAEELLRYTVELSIKRKPDNGGDVNYSEPSKIRADFASGALHPGDLKDGLKTALNAFLKPLREGVKSDAMLKKASACLAAVAKQQAKK